MHCFVGLLKPGLSGDLVKSGALQGIDLQQTGEELLALPGEILRVVDRLLNGRRDVTTHRVVLYRKVARVGEEEGCPVAPYVR